MVVNMEENKLNNLNDRVQEDINVEAQFLYGNQDKFGIYQLKDNEAMRDYRFESIEHLHRRGLEVDKDHYDLIYVGELIDKRSLDEIYEQFNLDRPGDFIGHSLSVSDLIVLHKDGENTAHFVDSFGFTEIDNFLEKENTMGRANQIPITPKETAEMAKVEVTLTVAECGEFHNLGEFHEGIATVEEALMIFNSIPPERMHGIPAIGIHLHTEGTEEYEDTELDILSGRMIDLDNLNYVSDIRKNPDAMDKIAELIAKRPDVQIYGVIPPQIEDKIQEYRYEGMSEAEQLADRIDQFTKEYDPYEYAEAVPDREAHLQQLLSDIEQGEAGYVAVYLQNVIEESADQSDLKTAKELADKLKEYKPLAKVEEIEEQNYNMIDNVLNNGCEKFIKKDEKQQNNVSLKERLEKKKEKIAVKQMQEKPGMENFKGQQREM